MVKYRKIVLISLAVLLASFVHFNRSGAVGPKTIEGRVYDEDFNPLAGIRVLLSVDGRFIGGVATDHALCSAARARRTRAFSLTTCLQRR